MLNPDGETKIPVYARKMYRNLPLNGMIENVDRDFMREALRFYAVGFGLGTGTVAEGWINDAAAFWEAQM